MQDDSPIYILAVDGGGTGCRARLSDVRGTILAEAKSGPANIKSKPEQALCNLRDLHLDALSGVSGRAIVHAHFGLAGVTDAAGAETTARTLKRELGLANCSVSDDRLTSLAGALAGGDGAVFAIGTGSFVAANRAGKVRLLGGWGAVLGDQAAGAWLGKSLLSHCLLAEDGIHSHSSLTREVLAGFEGIADQIVDFATAACAADFAAFAPRIADAAEIANPDPVALDLMQQGATWITGALHASGHRPGEAIAPLGGLGPRYVKYLEAGLQSDICAPQGNALDGAFWLACQAFVPQAI